MGSSEQNMSPAEWVKRLPPEQRLTVFRLLDRLTAPAEPLETEAEAAEANEDRVQINEGPPSQQEDDPEDTRLTHDGQTTTPAPY